jgi:hypothetical protein
MSKVWSYSCELTNYFRNVLKNNNIMPRNQCLSSQTLWVRILLNRGVFDTTLFWGNWDLYILRVWLDSFLLTELTSPYCCICPISGLPVHRLDLWKFDRGGIPYFCIYPSFPWFNVFHVFTTRGMSIWLGLWSCPAISVYHHKRCEFEYCSIVVYSIQHYFCRRLEASL